MRGFSEYLHPKENTYSDAVRIGEVKLEFEKSGYCRAGYVFLFSFDGYRDLFSASDSKSEKRNHAVEAGCA